jgi:hypothetical protein
MARRNTQTGIVQEQMVIPALHLGGYEATRNVNIGRRPSGQRHLIDVLAVEKSSNRKILVSLKWQQVSGTAEQKIPYEVMCLADALRHSEGEYAEAYLVLGGPGWSLRTYYLGDGLNDHLTYSHMVKIRTLENFIAQANQGRL